MPTNKWALPQSVQDSLVDPFVGDVRPRRANPLPATSDARTAAISVLFDYLAAIRYVRPGDKNGPPIVFQVPRENFLIDWPDGAEYTAFPSVAALEGSRGERLDMNCSFQEDTLNVYAPGTAILRTGEWHEEMTIEVWANYRAERRAILNGIEEALLPTELASLLRLRVKSHYDTLAAFMLKDSLLSGEADNVRGRRRAVLTVEMWVALGVLVNVNTMRPVTQLSVDYDNDAQGPVTVVNK